MSHFLGNKFSLLTDEVMLYLFFLSNKTDLG